MSENLYLTARLKVKKGAVEQIKQAALEIVEPSRAEAGCITYNVHQAIDDETVFVWRESWTNQAALDEHFDTEYVKNFFAIANELAAEPSQITLTKLIS